MWIRIALLALMAFALALRAEEPPAPEEAPGIGETPEGAKKPDPGTDERGTAKGAAKKPEQNAEGTEKEQGTKAPEFTLLDLDGKQRSLKEFAGKVVVLEWCNYGCPFVRKHYEKSGNIPALQTEYARRDVVWLSICSTEPGHRDYRDAKALKAMNKERKAAPTAMLLDADGKVGRAYKAKTTPHIFIVDKQGYLVYQGAIDSIRSANPEDIKTAKNYVREALDAVLANRKVPVAQTAAYGCSVKYSTRRPR